MTNPITTQSHSRVRFDDGDETGATWVALEDAANADPEWPKHFRIRLKLLNDDARIAGIQFALSWSLNGGGYTILSTTATHPVVGVPTTYYTNLTDCTEQLTDPGYDFDTSNAGMVDQLVVFRTGSFTFNKGDSMEAEWCLGFNRIKTGDYVDFRAQKVVGGATNLLDVYDNTPRITCTRYNEVSMCITDVG